MSVELATAYISIVPETSKIAPGINKAMGGVEADAGKRGKSMGGKLMGGLATAAKAGAVAAGAAAAAGFGTALVKGFNRLQAIEQAEAKLRGLGHSAESVSQIMDNASASVKGTAFGLGDAASAAASAVASGIKPGKDLERTLTLIGDSAAIAGADFGDMAAIFNKVSAGGIIQGEELAQLGDRGIPILQLLGEELGVSALEVKKLASEGKVDFETFQNAMERGMGGAAQESGKTFSGAMANVGAALGRIGANLLGGVFPKIAPMLQNVIGWLDKMAPIAKIAGEALGNGLSWAGEQIGKFVGQFQAGEGAGGRFRDILTAVKDAVVAGFGWVRDNAVPVLQNFIEQFRNGEGAGGKFRDILTAVWDAAKTAFGWIRDEGLPALQNLWRFIVDTLWPDIKTAFIDRIWPAMVEVGKAIKNFWEKDGKPALEGLWKFIKDVLAPFLVAFYEEGVKPTFDLIGKAIEGAWKFSREVLNKFKADVQSVEDKFFAVRDGIARAWRALTNIIARPINAVIDKINTFLSNMKAALNQIPGVDLTGNWTIRKIILDSGMTGSTGGADQRLASGGRVAGYSPHDRADNIPAWLTAGEYVLPVAATRSLASRFGPDFLEQLRQGLPGYATGGIVGGRGSRQAGASRTGGFLEKGWEWLVELVKDAGGWAKRKIADLTANFGTSWPAQAAKGAAGSTASALGKWIEANIFGGGGGGVGGRVNYGGGYGQHPTGMPWQTIWALIKSVVPNAIMTSNFRGGAITASGIPSLHGMGRAVDWVTPGMAGMTQAFRKVGALMKWSQHFYTPAGSGSQQGIVDAIIERTHRNHAHTALADGGLVKPLLFDSGGYLPTGTSLVHNGTGKPEPLIRGDQPITLSPQSIEDLADALADRPTVLRLGDRDLYGAVVRAESRYAGRTVKG